MSQSIAVIGAGIAGLSCAKTLTDLGYPVKVFEKSKGLSGRCSTRKRDDISFDHGAQFFTVKSDDFKKILDVGLSNGAIAQWQPKMYSEQQSASWYVGVPGMSSLGNLFELNSIVQIHCEVKNLNYDHQTWTISYQNQDKDVQENFDHVVLAIPPQQALALLQRSILTNKELDADLNPILNTLSQLEMYPCWTLMLETDDQFHKHWPYDAYQCPESSMESEAIAWVARNSSKPGRQSNGLTEQWIIQATPQWSRLHLEEQGEFISQKLINEVEHLFGIQISSSVVKSITHRWRYARVNPHQSEHPFILNPNLHLGICGDFFTKSRVEAAFLSGRQLAQGFA